MYHSTLNLVPKMEKSCCRYIQLIILILCAMFFMYITSTYIKDNTTRVIFTVSLVPHFFLHLTFYLVSFPFILGPSLWLRL